MPLIHCNILFNVVEPFTEVCRNHQQQDHTPVSNCFQSLT